MKTWESLILLVLSLNTSNAFSHKKQWPLLPTQYNSSSERKCLLYLPPQHLTPRHLCISHLLWSLFDPSSFSQQSPSCVSRPHSSTCSHPHCRPHSHRHYHPRKHLQDPQTQTPKATGNHLSLLESQNHQNTKHILSNTTKTIIVAHRSMSSSLLLVKKTSIPKVRCLLLHVFSAYNNLTLKQFARLRFHNLEIPGANCRGYYCEETDVCVEKPIDCPCPYPLDTKCLRGDWFVCYRGTNHRC